MSAPTSPAAKLQASVGREVGVSEWIELSQSRIDAFADATLDRQFIHVDPARAKETPFNGTIAHGFLVLSLLSRMWQDAVRPVEGAEMTLNYGLNRLRFLTPARAGERVRGRFVLREAAEKREGHLLLTYEVTVEIDGAEKPALVAEWLALAMLRPRK